MDVGTLIWLVCAALLAPACKSLPLSVKRQAKRPVITYAAGPDQLTLLFDDAFRFAYETNNQFRAERRFPNGTVAGYYGFIGADGRPIRVKYGAVDELGFQAVQEIIPEAFPETATEPEEAATEPTLEDGQKTAADQFIVPIFPIIDEEKDSVSVDAADFVQSRNSLADSGSNRFTFPIIDVPDLPRKRTSRQLPEAVPIAEPETVQHQAFRRRLLVENVPGEPAIIYADPSRYLQTVRAEYTHE